MKYTEKYVDSILIVGPPNVGKTTLFNKITWKLSKVANYDNVTFENSSGELRSNKNINIIDTPGLYSIDSIYKENNVVKHLIKTKSKICSVVSTTHFERDLYIVADLIETGNLSYIVLNKINGSNNKLNTFSLERKTGTKIFEINGNTGKGIKVFSNYISNESTEEKTTNKHIKYDDKIEKFINDVEKLDFDICVLKRFYAVQYLLKNKTIIEHSIEINIKNSIDKLIKKHNIIEKDIASIIETKKEFINKFLESANNKKEVTHVYVPEKRENLFQKMINNSYFVIFLFIISIFLIYFLTFSQWTGSYISDKMSEGFDELKNIISSSMLNSGINQWWIDFVNDGMFDGIFTTITFIPWIIILTTLTTLLEQIGFLSRVSLATDKALEKFGISGRTLVNLFMGTGCNIPAIMMCKNSSNKKEKIITTMIIPLISCSARVVVYGWIVQAFNFQTYNFLFIFSLTVISFIISLFVGLVFSNTMFRKTKTIFASEIIEWRWPDLSTTLRTMLIEVYSFVKKVFILIFFVSLIVWLMTNVSFTGIITDGDTSNSILRYISYPFEYLLYPTGIFINNSESWKLSMSLVSSFSAKEIAASNLETLFGGSYEFGIYLKTSAPNTWVALLCSYISFFMFYLPCLATAVTIVKELGWKYLAINIISIFCGTYVLSCIIYSVVGSISLIANDMTNISIIAIFSTLIVLFLILSIIKIFRVILQNKGYFEKQINFTMFKYINWSIIGIITILLITNNILIINS